MTIKEKLKNLKEKYSDFIIYVDYYKNREFYSSGPCTGKGSKGCKYIYTYYGKLKNNYDVDAESIEELEKKIIELI